jgi:hypothetical protein
MCSLTFASTFSAFVMLLFEDGHMALDLGLFQSPACAQHQVPNRRNMPHPTRLQLDTATRSVSVLHQYVAK